MRAISGDRPNRGFFRHHALSLVSVMILTLWIVLYKSADPKTHLGSFFGNAVADWLGVVVSVIATKYFYEIGSAESRQPKKATHGRAVDFLRKHSLSLFLVVTGAGWLFLYLRLNSEAKWGQVVGNIVSEWTQLLGLILMTKRLLEDKSRESK